MKVWKVTSPNGQILFGEEDVNNTVMLSSSSGNHGTVTMAAWLDKLAQMVKAGYTYTVKEGL